MQAEFNTWPGHECEFHVALTGGCLYDEGERKDADLIVYPHGIKAISPSDIAAIIDHLKKARLTLMHDGELPASAERDKMVRVFELRDVQTHPWEAIRTPRRVDIFFMDARPSAFPHPSTVKS